MRRESLVAAITGLLLDVGQAWTAPPQNFGTRRPDVAALRVSTTPMPSWPTFNATNAYQEELFQYNQDFGNPTYGHSSRSNVCKLPSGGKLVRSKKETATLVHRVMTKIHSKITVFNKTGVEAMNKEGQASIISIDVENVCHIMRDERLYVSSIMLQRVERLFWRMDQLNIAPTLTSFELIWEMQQRYCVESYKIQSKGRRVGRSIHLLKMWLTMAKYHPTRVSKPPLEYIQMIFEIAKENDVSMSFPMWDMFEHLTASENDLPRDFYSTTLGILYVSPGSWRLKQSQVIRALEDQYHRSGDSNFCPTLDELVVSFQFSVIFGNVTDSTSAWLFERLSKRMQGTAELMKYSDIYFNALRRSNDPQSVFLMGHLLLSPSSDRIFLDSSIKKYYNLALREWALSGMEGAGDQAKVIFDKMMADYRTTGDENFRPDGESVHHVVMAYIREEPLSLQRVCDAHRFLRLTLLKLGSLKDRASGHKTFEYLLSAYGQLCKNGESTPMFAADRLFRFFWVQYRDGNISEEPNRFHLSHILKMINMAKPKSGAQDCYERYQSVRDLKDNGRISDGPDAFNTRQLLSAMSQSEEPRYGKIAADLLNEVLDEQSVTVTTDAYSLGHMFYCAVKCNCDERTKESLYRAKELIERLEEIHKENPSRVRLSGAAYGKVIAAWGKVGGDGAGEQAQQMMEKLQAQEVSGNRHCRISWEQYAHVISAWSLDPTPNVIARVHELQDHSLECHHHHPVIDMNVAIAHATCPDEGSLDEAERILTQLNDGFVAGDDAKRVSSFAWNALLDALSKKTPASEALPRCLDLLGRMGKIDRTGRLVAEKTSWTCESLMRAWSRSGKADALHEMEALYQSSVAAYEKGNKKMKPLDAMIDMLLEKYSNTEEDDAATAKKATSLCRQII